MTNTNSATWLDLVPQDDPNRDLLETIAAVSEDGHRLGVPVMWCKADIDDDREERYEPPLTDEQWNRVATQLEIADLFDWDWEVLNECIDRVING